MHFLKLAARVVTCQQSIMPEDHGFECADFPVRLVRIAEIDTFVRPFATNDIQLGQGNLQHDRRGLEPQPPAVEELGRLHAEMYEV